MAATNIIELRIHGAGGSTLEEMLGPDAVCERLEGGSDDRFGFFELRSGAPDGVTRHAYVWGRREGLALGLWLWLLPFTLVNVAGWSLASGTRPFGAKFGRWVVALLGLALTAAWTLWAVRIFGEDLTFARPERLSWLGTWWAAIPAGIPLVLAVLALRSPRLTARDAFRPLSAASFVVVAVAAGFRADDEAARAVLAVLAAALATLLPFVLADVNRRRFEEYRPPKGVMRADHKRRLHDEETIASPCFFDHPTDSRWLTALHLLVALALLAVVGLRAWDVHAGALGHPTRPLAGGAGAGVSFLARAFLVVGFAQAFLVASLVVAGYLGASRASAGRRDSWFNLLLNGMRPAAIAGLGVFLFTAVVGSLDVLLSRANGERIGLLSHAQVELVPAFLAGSAVAAAVVAALLLARFVRSTPPGEVAAHGRRERRRWRWFLTVQWLVAEADRVVVFMGVTMLGALLWSAGAHRADGGWWRLTPAGDFGGVEASIMGLVPWVGVAVVVVPLAVGAFLARIPHRLRLFRRGVAGIWDVLGFWPRRFHPLGVPPEAERAVPEVQSHLLGLREFRLHVVGHSQGTVIALAALAGLGYPRTQGDVALLTCGSPLFALYARTFPAQVAGDLLADMATRLRGGYWVNLARVTDFFGIPPDPRDACAVQLAQERVSHLGARGELLAHDLYFLAEDVEGHVRSQSQLLGR